MSKRWIIILFLFFFIKFHAQADKDSIDLKYLEDQLYLSLTSNVLVDKPLGISQNGFSGGFSMGFIKDIPLNRKRNFGIGVGLGYAYNAFIQNLKIFQENQETQFSIAKNYKSNKLAINEIEFPIELRWRNSTPKKYKFWRIYAGIKASYILTVKTSYKDDIESLTTKNITEFNRFQYGMTLAAGFSTWNLYVYYGLNPFFKKVNFNGEDLNLRDFNIGLKFYIM